MRLALWILAVVLGTTAVGCSSPYGDVRHGGYSPNYDHAAFAGSKAGSGP